MKENEMKLQDLSQYGCHCNDADFTTKLKKFGTRLGHAAVKDILTLWYVMKSPATPIKDKVVIAGALGYFILPVDLIPDMVPVLGFTDDLTAIGLALKAVRSNITPEIERQVAAKMPSWL